ncbi:hypothetical protein [Streptomyces sp. NPDC057301]|uniref:EamA family transporter n=1 Tax=Streptomyces sp. NPDC057301 TaxID=3346093 RepID=UPI00363CBBDA
MSLTDLARGALSGVGSAAAMHFLNRGLSRGAMSTVVPVSAVTAVTAVALSVLGGVLLLGDRPCALARTGFLVTVPALWLYLLAAQRQLPAVAVLLASLHPALPVVLGFVLLRERLTVRRVIGLTGAAVATLVLTLG